MTINPQDIYERLMSAGSEWADADAGASLLEETKKPLLSNLVAKAPEGSMASKESWAYGRTEYREHIQLMVENRRLANRAKVKYESAKVYCDLSRTVAATERITLKHAP